MERVFYGGVVSPQSLHSIQVLPRCLLAVGSSGTIEWMVNDIDRIEIPRFLSSKCLPSLPVDYLEHGQFLVPGFIDTHAHAPQFPNVGSGQQYELLDWLDNVTFPMEERFSDVGFAKTTYTSVVRHVIDSGTTTCCYFGSLQLEATKILADIVLAKGQRAFVGKCNMDRNAPASYLAADTSPLENTTAFVDYVRSLGSPLVQPILTPRFAISCTGPLLDILGSIAAASPSLRIQSHVSENPNEIAFTESLFPECSHYTGIYERHGLLRHNTILAHGVHLAEDEIELIHKRRVGISHCPTSNFNLRSGVAPIGKYLDRGIKVGLGTDVSGGYSISILNAVQNASIASKVIAMQQGGVPSQHAGFEGRQLSCAALFHMATLGGAQLCDLESEIGSLVPGKSFDALLVDVRTGIGGPGIWGVSELAADMEGGRSGELERMLEQFLFCGDDRNIQRVYVQGRLIGGREMGHA